MKTVRNHISSKLLIAVTLLCTLPLAADAQVELEVRLTDTLVESGSDHVTVPLYVTNYSDSIGGYALLLETDRPDLISFDLRRVTEGTLSEDWEFVSLTHPSGDSSRLRIVALAETGSPPPSQEI